MTTEAIFLADCAHAKFVHDVLHDDFPSLRLLALTADAHGSALRFGAENVVGPYDLADYDASLGADVTANLRLSQEWLAELDLAIIIEGVNLAELDGLNQFLFFQQATYLARTAEAMIAALPAETVLRVPFGETPLPADLYLDSDIAGAIVRHVGERLGRRVEPLLMARRPLHFAAWTDRRPFLNDSVRTSAFRRRSPDRRIGFAPTVTHDIIDYFVTFNGMTGDDVVVFDSPWAERPPGPELDGPVAEEGWVEQARTMLDQYRQAFWHRIGRSSLPDCLRDNPYLRFQFDYILTERWLSYARYIYSAAHFVRDNPLDLMISCDHFIGEGAILATLYRRAGARTAIAPHALHLCDVPFAAWHPSDSAIVRSGFAAGQALGKGGLAAAYTVPAARPAPAPARPRKGPRRILFLGNAVEAPQPLVNMRRYLAVIADLAAPPPDLSGRVKLASRLKPGVFSEYKELHCQLCGCDPEIFQRVEGMSLEESIAWADCVVGAGIPTSAYVEVLAQGKPLLHVGLEPYFPASANHFPEGIEGCVIEADRLWAEIEAALFDPAARRKRLDRQRRWYEADRLSSFPEAADPLRAAIEAVLANAD